MPSMTDVKPKQMKIKQEKGEHKSEAKGTNKGDKKFSQAGAQTERGKSGSGDAYVKTGMTKGMHGKAKGGHPSIRAQEMKGC